MRYLAFSLFLLTKMACKAQTYNPTNIIGVKASERPVDSAIVNGRTMYWYGWGSSDLWQMIKINDGLSRRLDSLQHRVDSLESRCPIFCVDSEADSTNIFITPSYRIETFQRSIIDSCYFFNWGRNKGAQVWDNLPAPYHDLIPYR